MALRKRAVREVEQAYRQHGPVLMLFAWAIAGTRERAQDAVHQVFLKLLQDHSLDRASDKKAYLFACVRNAVINEARILQRNSVLDEDAIWFEPPKRDYGAELRLRRALSDLPPDQRQVIILHIWGELTFSQVADLLEISSNTAASRYRYALAKLRDLMSAKESSCAQP